MSAKLIALAPGLFRFYGAAQRHEKQMLSALNQSLAVSRPRSRLGVIVLLGVACWVVAYALGLGF